MMGLFVSELRGASNVEFHNLNNELEISIRETNQVCSDDLGFIWISSKMGIVRYAQDDIRIYQLPYETADILTVRLVFKDGVLYAYSNSGQIFRYDNMSDKFEMEINVRNELQNSYILINNILVDDSGRLWLSSNYGLYSYKRGEGLKSRIGTEQIYHTAWFGKDRFFFATDGQIGLYNIEDFTSEAFFVFPGESNFLVYRLLYDYATDMLWIGTLGEGLFYVNRDEGQLNISSTPNIPKQPILDLELVSDSTLMVGIDGQGAWEISKDGSKVVNVFKEDSNNPNSLRGNGVYDIYRERNNRIWISTYSGGVSYFDQANPFVTRIDHMPGNENSLINNDVNDVLEDSYGNLWFATNNGISRWNIKSDRWESYYEDEQEQAHVFLSICEDDQGRIWAGTYSSGVYLLDIKSGKELAHYSSTASDGEFESDFILTIYQDQVGDIWFGGVRGNLICYKNDEEKFRSYNISTISVLTDYLTDKLLVGSPNGLVMLDKVSGDTEVLLDGVLIQDILLINDVVWICTNGEGIIRYDIRTGEKQHFSDDSGLPSNFVNSAVFANGYIWFGTEHGMCRLKEDQDQETFVFTLIQDLRDVAFNRGAHWNLRDGRVLWGSNKGGVLLDPEEVSSLENNGKIFYHDLQISGRSVRESGDIKLESPLDSLKELTLKYSQNNINLELIPLNLISSGTKFSWKLEGFDEQWSKPGKNRVLSYSNIPNGAYTLRIRMMDSSMANVLAERSVKLTVTPPFWQEWWFKLVVFVGLSGLGIFVLLFYLDHIRKKHSEEKIRFFTNTAHDMRTSLTLINGPIEELNKEQNLSNQGLHFLNLATEQAHRLANVVTQLMDFQKVDVGKEKMFFSNTDIVEMIKSRVMMFDAHAKSKGIDMVFLSNLDHFESWVDETMIEKIVDNLISNAIKYSNSNGQVQVSLNCNNQRWTLEVKDQGIGIGKQAQRLLFREYFRGDNAVNAKIVGSGIGLLLVKNYVGLHGGRVNCFSQLNEGATFQVVIPYRKKEHGQESNKLNRQTSNVYQPANLSSLANKELTDSETPKMKVLVVEDHEDLREFLSSALHKQFTVYLAEDGEKAWDIIQKTVPDIVVSDIMMPNMDGFELCSKLKSTWQTSHIPIILLTALNGKTQQLQGLGLGADDYLTKPFDITLLQQRITTIIQNREIIRDKALKLIKIDKEADSILENEHNDKFLKRIVEVVRTNISNPQFSKKEFAFALNVSPSLLYLKVKSLTNQSPSDFIRSVRLEHSLDLLKSREYSVTEVSELCGFKNVGYFSTIFKKNYGKSPTQIS